jgi:hypothetical protein
MTNQRENNTIEKSVNVLKILFIFWVGIIFFRNILGHIHEEVNFRKRSMSEKGHPGMSSFGKRQIGRETKMDLGVTDFSETHNPEVEESAIRGLKPGV